MIDVHILTYSGTRREWLDQCLASLEGEPCTVHVVEGVEGCVGAGRAMAYRLGTHEYVSYVDSDDYVLPGVMRACAEAMRYKRAVVTLERRLWGSRFDTSLMGGHHLVVYRRADVLPQLPRITAEPVLCDHVLLQALGPYQLDLVGYVWRMHNKQAHRALIVEE